MYGTNDLSMGGENAMTPEQILFCGIVIVAAAVIAATAAAIVLYISKRRLNEKLIAEFGKKRH